MVLDLTTSLTKAYTIRGFPRAMIRNRPCQVEWIRSRAGVTERSAPKVGQSSTVNG
jgi:hypothetical protein